MAIEITCHRHQKN